MRILLPILFTTLALPTISANAAVDQSRLKRELEYLRNNAFLDQPSVEMGKANYFDRSSTQKKTALKDIPGDIIDLDQVYFSGSGFSDSVSNGMAAPAKQEVQQKSKD